MYHLGEWGTICASEFTSDDGQVLCDHLNYGEYKEHHGILRYLRILSNMILKSERLVAQKDKFYQNVQVFF